MNVPMALNIPVLPHFGSHRERYASSPLGQNCYEFSAAPAVKLRCYQIVLEVRLCSVATNNARYVLIPWCGGIKHNDRYAVSVPQLTKRSHQHRSDRRGWYDLL